MFTKDDMFVLGNLAALAVLSKRGELAFRIIRLLNSERPDNAGGHLLYAIHLHSSGKTKEAITYLEDSSVFEARINREEAMAFHLLLLKNDRQYERALDLGHAYLETDTIISESSHHTVRMIISEIENRQSLENSF